MPRDLETIAFAGSQERAAFEALVRDRPGLWGWFSMGEQGALQYAVPRIRNGVLGSSAKAIDAKIGGLLESAMTGLRQGRPEEQADEDECFAYRLGFMSVATPVRDAKLGVAQPAAPVLPKPLPRRLTPADFGCLPMPGQHRS